ncbi:MAG: hypothetical protein HYU64_04085 [Armatimonadetes bacterium]|nr:hypothetical protein [Armatimonadota bacterium]
MSPGIGDSIALSATGTAQIAASKRRKKGIAPSAPKDTAIISAGHEETGRIQKSRASRQSSTVAASSSPAVPSSANLKEWNVMIYMAADNNLEEYMTTNVVDMERVGSSDKMNVLVELDRGEYPTPIAGGWKGARRYRIEKDDDHKNINSPVAQDLGRVDMSDPAHLTDFLVWGMKNYPAKHHLLILNDHGGGFVGAIEDDDTGGGRLMKISAIAKAMEEAEKITGQKIEVVSFDACLMGQTEVAYELRSVSDILLASEELIGGTGMAYGEVLGLPVTKAVCDAMAGIQKLLSKKGRLSAEECVSAIVENTKHHQDTTPTMSAVRLGTYVEGIAKESDKLAKALIKSVDMKRTSPEVFLNILKESQQFCKDAPFLKPYGDYRDLYDIGSRLIKDPRITDPVVKEAAKTLLDNIQVSIVAQQSADNNYKDAHGFSIYAPTGGGSDYGYSETAFAADTAWDDLFKKIGKMDPKAPKPLLMPPPFLGGTK